MRTIIELDTQDIREAIAAKFGCRADQVDLEAVRTCVGYGMGEHYVDKVIARIDKNRTTNSGVTTNLTVGKENIMLLTTGRLSNAGEVKGGY